MQYTINNIDDVWALSFCANEGHEDWIQCERGEICCHAALAGLAADLSAADLSWDYFSFTFVICTLT